MIRTQIQLGNRQAVILKELAKSSGESIAGLIRQALDQFILTRGPDRQALYRRAVKVIGKYEAKTDSDVAANDQVRTEDLKK